MNQNMDTNEELEALENYLLRVPGINSLIGRGYFADGNWWVKFKIDINHPLAWQVVQELGFVLNYVSVNERLPTVFMPVSPPPYLNGGPEEFLYWVIEAQNSEFTHHYVSSGSKVVCRVPLKISNNGKKTVNNSLAYFCNSLSVTRN